MISVFRGIGRQLARWLTRPLAGHASVSPATDRELLMATLMPGDVLLVEGLTRISVAIKYLTQSTWSHAALYVGPQSGDPVDAIGAPAFVEADAVTGVRLVGVGEYAGLHTRVCRPVGLTGEDCQALIDFALSRIGQKYDLKNVFDLARYLFPTPPVPVRWRRRMLAFGSGDPTRAICSTLIAQCFQSIRYPILPQIEIKPAAREGCDDCVEEVLRRRHHSLFVPRDFDTSPYFAVVKPSLVGGFDYRALHWADSYERTDDGELPRP